MEDPVHIDANDNVHIRIELPRCRKCRDRLYGGEIEAGICDSCDNFTGEYVD